MNVIQLVGGVAMALTLADAARAAEPTTGVSAPCPFLKPMARCAPQARVPEAAADLSWRP